MDNQAFEAECQEADSTRTQSDRQNRALSASVSAPDA